MPARPHSRSRREVKRPMHQAVTATPLRVLLLEDNVADADLLIHHLRRAGFDPDWRRVATKNEFLSQLDPSLDLVLAGHSRPTFDAFGALGVLRERHLDIPCIVVSGSIGEELAVQALKEGAADYLLKDRLQRIGPAVERALEEKKLRDEYQQLIAIVTCSDDAIISRNASGMIVSWNAGAERLFGYSADEVKGRPITIIVPEDRRWELDDIFAKITSGERVVALETVRRHKNGSLIDVSFTVSPVLNSAGEIVAFASITRDVTRRKRAEEALRDSEKRYRSMFEALRESEGRARFALEAGGVGIWDADPRTGKVTWSETLEALHGFAPGTFKGTLEGFFEHIHPDDREPVRAAIGRSIREKTDWDTEYRTTWSDGGIHWLIGKGRPLYNEAGEANHLLGIGIDVTERRQLEARLVQVQKMEAIGQLAGGVAHDFNNLLTAILGYAAILAEEYPEGDQRRRDIDEIQRAAERAAELTRQLLAFSRQQILHFEVVNVNTVAESFVGMLRRLIGEDIELRLNLEPTLGRVKADVGQLEQVIMNLAVNARDAMARGGTLTIETRNAELDNAYLSRHALVSSAVGPHVMLAVSDTGSGMDARTQKHIFEPFFTTKVQGKGTGLGLATVYGVVKQSGGYIWVYSEPGLGTTFKIYLPRIDSTVIREPKTPRAKEGPSHGTETVLLVEDEESVRLLTRTLLERNGYRVLEGADAKQAFEVASQQQNPVDLLLTDVVMPGESGPDLFERLKPLRPQMKVLFVSGYTDDSIVRHGVLEAEVPFLQKPFSASELTRKVREVLDSAPVS